MSLWFYLIGWKCNCVYLWEGGVTVDIFHGGYSWGEDVTCGFI